MNELVRAKNVPARQCLENAAEDGFVKAELLLDGLCREPDLPTNMALTRRDTALDERKLNAIGVIASAGRNRLPGRTRRAHGRPRNPLQHARDQTSQGPPPLPARLRSA